MTNTHQLREAAKRWLRTGPTSPATGKPINPYHLEGNQMAEDRSALANYAAPLLADDTPATVEWLEGNGWEMSKPLGTFMVSPCGKLEFQVASKSITHGEWGEVLIASPTRSDVLGLLAVLGPKDRVDV